MIHLLEWVVSVAIENAWETGSLTGYQDDIVLDLRQDIVGDVDICHVRSSQIASCTQTLEN